MEDLVPNHHAHYRQFTGVFGYLAGLTMIAGRGSDARLVVDLAEVADDDHVLDVGCGPGTAVRMAAQRGGRITGVDPSAPMLRLARLLTAARRPAGAVEWVCAGAERMPLPDGSVTVCWSLASVHHWPELEAGVDEVRRVLVADGLFLALEKRTRPGATGNASHGWTPPQADRFAALLADSGFDGVEVSHHDHGRREVVVVQGRAPASAI